MSSEEYPKRGSQWRHHSGRLYTVIETVSITSTSPKYPATVIYIGRNGNKWAKSLISFRETMTSVLDGLGKGRLNDLLAELKVHVTMMQCNSTKPNLIRERAAKLIGEIGALSSTGAIGMITELVEAQVVMIRELRSELEGKSDMAAEAIHQLNTEIERLNKVIAVHRKVGDEAEDELLQAQTNTCLQSAKVVELQAQIDRLSKQLLDAAGTRLEMQTTQKRVNADNERRLNELNKGIHKLQLTLATLLQHEHIMVQCISCNKLLLCPSCNNAIKAH